MYIPVGSYVQTVPFDKRLNLSEESKLIRRFANFCIRNGSSVTSLEILRAEGRALVPDLYNPERRLIIEAKIIGALSEPYRARQNVRAALAQLFDYGRFIIDPKLAVLLDELPSPDPLSLVLGCGVGVIVEAGPGRFEELWPDCPESYPLAGTGLKNIWRSQTI